MTPGIPWSVLGIQPDARAAAEAKARRAGIPVGEWLNDMIRRSAEPAPSEPPVFSASSERNPRNGAASASTLRSDYDRLTAEIAALNLRDAETGLARASAARGHGQPQDGDPIEVVERTIQAIVQHLELSDRRNADALRALQSEMRHIAARADVGLATEGGAEPRRAIAHIEQRLEELAGKIEASRPAEPGPDAEFMEDRLAELAARIERLTGQDGASTPPQPASPAKEPTVPDDPAFAGANGKQEANAYVTAFMRRRARRQGARGAAAEGEPPPERMSERFADLADSLRSSLSDPSPPREVADLHRLVRDLSAKIDALAAREPAPAPVDPELPQHVA